MKLLTFHLIFWTYLLYQLSQMGYNEIRICEEVNLGGRKLEKITQRQNKGINNWEETTHQRIKPHPDLWQYHIQKVNNCQEITFQDGQVLAPLLIGIVFKLCLFYGIVLWILPAYLHHQHLLGSIGWAVVWIVGLLGIELGLDYLYIQSREPMIYPDAFCPDNWRDIRRVQFMMYPWIIFWALLYRFGADWLQHQQLQEQLRQEKLHTELHFLKSQINPHFLFNTLNNLYGMALTQQADRTAEGIAKLAQQMRYMLYDSEVEHIALSKEIDYLQTFFSLQKLRFSEEDNIHIDFSIQGEVANCHIAPMLLIPFVENAFKHSLSFTQAVSIIIHLTIQGNRLSFEVQNTINPHNNSLVDTQPAGLGLANVSRRLELLYPNRYTLKIDEQTGVFEVKLCLDL